MLYPSKYNHLVRCTTSAGREVRILSNLFLGAADVVNEEVYDSFDAAERNGASAPSPGLPQTACEHFVEKGYLYTDPDAEEKKVRAISENYRTRDQIAAGLEGGQYGFITSLQCNLACPYCFQQKKADSTGFLSKRQVDSGLASIAKAEEHVAALMGAPSLPKISITGGEPLLRNRANLEVLDYLLSRLEDLGWPFNITTNGTELREFVAEHQATGRCRNVQVTLDGPREVHDGRRCFRGGGPSFEKICAGIDAALRSGWNLTLRVCLDMANVRSLPELAAFIIGRGWANYNTFSAYVSPVTDHGSICGDVVPRDEAHLLDALLNVIKDRPDVSKIFDVKHFRGFNYVERLLVQKNPRFPVIFRCEAVTGMYIFDPLGDIHVCLEAVGDPSLRIGTYDPMWRIEDEAFARWTTRNALSVSLCQACKVRFLCAGGCTMESFHREDSEVCMPFLREIDIAWHYFAQARPELFA
ncbi:MAG: radical SAM protein [Chloroflexi bacterium]|nr:radical SAM protein [Chloroflexota bacterium]